jgi:wobble nucleotide-excising tRNase
MLQERLASLASDYSLSKNQQDLAVDLTAFGQLVFQKSALDLDSVGIVLNKNVQQLSKEVLENKINEVKALFEDEAYQQSTEKWFRFGKNVLDSAKEHGGQIKCPICDTDISARLDDILRNFNGYFDKGYESFISELKTRKEQVRAAIDLIDKCSTDSSVLGRLWEKYKTQMPAQIFTAFDFSGVKSEMETILKACDSKLADIQFSFPMPQSAISTLSEMNTAIEGFDGLKNSSQTILGAKKLDRGKIEDEIRATYKAITLLEFDKLDKGENFERYKQNQKKIFTISTTDPTNESGLLFYQNKRREELKKIKAESKSISKFLKIMGIDHFIVDINEDASDENIIIKYNTSGADKNKLRNCLSEGEKTALAFSYFLSKFENERDMEEKRKESVVVIDDPISSLDENRLYSTAHLIRDNFKTVRQLIVLSHNFLFLKFFNAAYSHTNCMFINGDKLTELPEELRNFESPYFYMLKTL